MTAPFDVKHGMYRGLGPSDSFSDKGSQKHEALDTVNDLTGLTLRQCRAVQECWRDFTIGSVNRLGVQFLVRFFLAFPDYRNFYGALRSDSDVHNKGVNRHELRMLQDSNELRELAMAYMDTLTAIFTQLHDQKAVTAVLENLTDRHLPRGVFSLHFQDMMATLLKFIEEKTGRGRMDTVTRDSWTTALRTVITIIDQRCLLLQHKIYTRA